MIYLVSLLGYGDNLITGSILERKDKASVKLRTVGSAVTQKVWSLLANPIEPNEVIFNDVPAFYVIKERGIRAAFRDANVFRGWAESTLLNDDCVIFENNARFRNRWLLNKISVKSIDIDRHTSAYTDRSLAIEKYLGPHVWEDSAAASAFSKNILINPSARSKRRTIPKDVVEVIIETTNMMNINTSLIDVDGSLGALKSCVKRYILNPTLMEAVSALREADRYIGPDSFFMHLAYYYKIPQVALFWKEDIYFRPPGLMEQGGIYYFNDLKNIVNFKHKLLGFMSGTVVI